MLFMEIIKMSSPLLVVAGMFVAYGLARLTKIL